jgi:surfactin synthase thioesterase subunit
MTATTRGPARSLPIAPSPTARARVFLVPYSGCGASVYRRWPRERNGVEYCAVQPPGREHRLREPSYRTFGELAEELCRDLAPYLDRPYALFGHCASALPAYQTVVELARAGLPAPARLYVSSQVAPQDGPVSRFLSMSDAELIVELRQLMAEMGAEPLPGMLELHVKVLRADLEAHRRFVVPEPAAVSCPITAIGWAEDEDIPADRMDGWPRCGDTTDVLLPGRPDRFVVAPDDLLDLIEVGLAGD